VPYIQTPNLKIHYQVVGDGNTQLVLLHGNFASWRWWQPVLTRLPAHYRAYAADMRGCGDSERPGFGHNIEMLVNDVHAFVSSLGLGPVHLIGHSLGGAVALQLLRRRRQKGNLSCAVGILWPTGHGGCSISIAKPQPLALASLSDCCATWARIGRCCAVR
jgi:pimeloyl-ACP methyl ester carboxylesterase